MAISGTVGQHTLTNGIITIGLKNAGAELTSLRSAQTGLEYLWQADPAFWGKHAPVLFPVVGRLKNDAYTYQGATYRMNQHGLARNMRFETVEKAQASISFRLRYSEETLKQYPFTFELVIGYSLENDTLRIGYEVINLGNEPMLFSIGAHPGFRCPLVPGEDYEDYYLVWDDAVTLPRNSIDDGLIAPHTEPFLSGRRELGLSRDLFDRGAIVLKNVRFSQVALQSRKTGHGVAMDMAGFPYFGVWAVSGADFVCLEPWYGIADSVGATGRLEDKEGIITLKDADSFRASYTITPR